MAVGWYSCLKIIRKRIRISDYFKEARTKAQMGIYVDANLAYDTAISMKESKNLMCKLLTIMWNLIRTNSYQGVFRHNKKNSKDEAGYRRLVEYYYYAEDFKIAMSI